jgi:hypothetical protein
LGCGYFENYFKDTTGKKLVRDSCLLEYIVIIIAYEFANDSKSLSNILNIIKNILYVVHQNYLIISDFIVSKISSQSISNMWVNKAQNLILTKLNKRLKKGEHLNLLKQNNENITGSFKNIFRTCSNKMESIVYFWKNLNKISVHNLNEYFKTKCQQYANKNSSVPASLVIEEGESLPLIPVPYFKAPTKREFCLVLDLDETLIHFKIVKFFLKY